MYSRSISTPSSPLRLAVVIALACGALHSTADAQGGPDADALHGVDFCGSEVLLERRLAADPDLAARRELFEAMLREAERRGLVPSPEERSRSTAAAVVYTIPVAVHIVHYPGTPIGVAENISDAQVLSQIQALNRDCQNLPGNPFPAVDTQMQFCLATQVPSGSGVTWSTTPGITRTAVSNPTVVFNNNASDAAIKAINYLPSNRYLNIWVVAAISSNVVGYAYFPGTVPPTLDGIVMAYNVFGSNSYGSFSLLPGYADGKVMAHEVGHWLNLFHTFHLGCTPPDDHVFDTPPEAVNNWGCPPSAPTSCSSLPDPIENFMDYTNDACRWAFTQGQKTRMHAAMATYRSQLSSGQNLVATGVTCAASFAAPIVVDQGQVCVPLPGTLQFSTISGTGYTYSWTFAGGTPATSTLQNPTVQYGTAGAHAVTLTITDASNNTSTSSTVVYATACAPISGICTNWVWPSQCRLSFASGLAAAVNGTVNVAPETGSQISDAAGNLLFYTDNTQVWDATHTVTPNGSGIIGGTSAHNGALFCPRPGSSTQYFMFNIRQWEDDEQPDPLHVTTLDATLNGGLGDVVASSKNVNVPLPGGPKRLLEGQTLVPHCNGVDWWLVTHGAAEWGDKLYVTLVTSAGPVSTVSYPIGLGTGIGNLTAWGAITSSRDGTKIAACRASSQSVRVYDFNRATGVPTLAVNTGNVGANHDVAFSPSGKLIYYSYYDPGTSSFGIHQMKLSTLQTKVVVFPGPERDVELGPDGRLYIAASLGSAIGCVNFPDQFNALDQNECGYNPSSVPLGNGTVVLIGSLPNTLQMCSGTQAAQFTYTVTNCFTVSFQSPNCAGPWTWDFGDNTGGSGQSVSHTYSAPGTYNVQLTVANAVPPTVTIPVKIGADPITIVGPSFACGGPLNYSVVGPSSYTYTWTITGGTPTSATGNNVFVSWGLSGGTIQVTATDPATGCTSTALLGVEYCSECAKPPLGIVAWWPLDETSGVVAQEIVAGHDGQDINGPAMVAGAVSNSRQFNGSSSFVRLNDPAKLNLGTADLTIDAWIRNAPGGAPLQGIVDKRSLSPDQGYALYLKQGRLALYLADGSSGTEYWTSGTPNLADGEWHHVAATEDRANAATGTRLFVDGSPVAVFPGHSASANLDNAERLVIGAQQPWTAPVSHFNGNIDELEIFDRALTDHEVAKIWGAGAAGKCKEYCHVPWDQTICATGTSVTLTMQVCNFGTQQQTFNVSFSGLPSGTQGPAGGCSWAGPAPADFPNVPPVTVLAGQCKSVQIVIQRPAGMPNGQVSCFAATITNQGSGASRTCLGSIWTNGAVCPSPWSPDFVSLEVGQTATLRWRLVNATDSPIDVPVRVETMPSDPSPDEPNDVISLNGLPPGTAYATIFSLAPGESTLVSVDAAFTRSMPFRFYDAILSADADFDGVDDALSSIGLISSGRALTIVDSPPSRPPARLGLLNVTPNPLRAHARVEFDLPRRERVDLALYDLGGRRIRTLVDGTLEAGPNAFAWDASRIPLGLYFLKLRAAGETRTRTVVVLR